MHERAQDAMSYVRAYGRPDLFITFTTNPKWDEIQELLLRDDALEDSQQQMPGHRHDIVARVFKQKHNKLMDLINKGHIFGPPRAHLYSIEWQKRGLPHSHTLIWLENKIHANEIDSIISAEFPNEAEDPILFNIIKNNMLHGPCGPHRNYSPCMDDQGKCTKKYPRDLIPETKSDGDGYPLYRRRRPGEGGYTATIKVDGTDVEVDNSWVVPHNKTLSRIFNAHINVEYCNSVKAIKYVCKYCNKGPDRAIFEVTPENNNDDRDEIKMYQTGRYISSNEAYWRIFGCPIHDHKPTVMQLQVHLENGQSPFPTRQYA